MLCFSESTAEKRRGAMRHAVVICLPKEYDMGRKIRLSVYRDHPSEKYDSRCFIKERHAQVKHSCLDRG